MRRKRRKTAKRAEKESKTKNGETRANILRTRFEEIGIGRWAFYIKSARESPDLPTVKPLLIVGEDGSAAQVDVPVNGTRAAKSIGKAARSRPEVGALHLLDVAAGLAESGNTMARSTAPSPALYAAKAMSRLPL